MTQPSSILFAPLQLDGRSAKIRFWRNVMALSFLTGLVVFPTIEWAFALMAYNPKPWLSFWPKCMLEGLILGVSIGTSVFLWQSRVGEYRSQNQWRLLPAALLATLLYGMVFNTLGLWLLPSYQKLLAKGYSGLEVVFAKSLINYPLFIGLMLIVGNLLLWKPSKKLIFLGIWLIITHRVSFSWGLLAVLFSPIPPRGEVLQELVHWTVFDANFFGLFLALWALIIRKGLQVRPSPEMKVEPQRMIPILLVALALFLWYGEPFISIEMTNLQLYNQLPFIVFPILLLILASRIQINTSLLIYQFAKGISALIASLLLVSLLFKWSSRFPFREAAIILIGWILCGIIFVYSRREYDRVLEFQEQQKNPKQKRW